MAQLINYLQQMARPRPADDASEAEKGARQAYNAMEYMYGMFKRRSGDQREFSINFIFYVEGMLKVYRNREGETARGQALAFMDILKRLRPMRVKD